MSMFLFSCKSNSQKQNNRPQTANQVRKGSISNIDAIEFQKVIQNPDVQLIDIRTLREYKPAHIKGAIWIDWYKSTFRSYVRLLDKQKPVALYCHSGNRSGKAAFVLKSLGFQKIYNLRHGINDWYAHKLPVTAEESEANRKFQEKIKNAASSSQQGDQQVYHVDAATFKKVADQEKVQLVDIRTSREYQSGYIKGSVNIDWYQRDFKDQIQHLSKDKPIAIYCRSGNRSGKAALLLKSLGFKKIINLAHGINDWNRMGYPLERPVPGTK